MGARLPFAVLAIAALVGGCGFFFEPKPDLENKKTAKVAGLTVDYPGNWKTESESEDVGEVKFSSLTIESSGSALAVIQVFEPGIDLAPAEVFDTYIEGMKEASETEFGGVVNMKARQAKDFQRELMKTTWNGRQAQVDLALLGETVPHRLQTVQRSTEDKTIIVIVQAPTEDWTTAAPGFDAIYDSLAEG